MLWRCEICGDPYIGDKPPSNCAFCGVKQKYMKLAKLANVDFNVELSDIDRKNVETALGLEIGNAAFYRCAEKQTNDPEGKLLFKILRKVESEHAEVWQKILKLDSIESLKEQCSIENKDNLEESHKREDKAIAFYKNAAKESTNDRVREIFNAFIEVETDHLKLSEERLR